MHVNAALLARFHPDYGLSTLLARSLVCMVNKLLPGMTDAQKQVGKLEKELARLRRKRPASRRGRHEFFGEIAIARSTEVAQHQAQTRKELLKKLAQVREEGARPPLQPLGAADLQVLAQSLDSPAFSAGEVMHKRDKACVAPERMSTSLAALLDRPLDNHAGGDEPLPSWLAEVARRREYFERTGFEFELNGETQARARGHECGIVVLALA